MTIALRVPILQNCCGPGAAGTSTLVMSSPGRSAFCLTPV